MYKNHQTGKQGEEIASQYLQNNNYKIIKRNFYCRQGEIDIIALDISKKELVFIEVKTRKNNLYGSPSEAVNRTKQAHLQKCIKYYIYKNKLEKYCIRIDVIEVYIFKNKIKINHIKQIF